MYLNRCGRDYFIPRGLAYPRGRSALRTLARRNVRPGINRPQRLAKTYMYTLPAGDTRRKTYSSGNRIQSVRPVRRHSHRFSGTTPTVRRFFLTVSLARTGLHDGRKTSLTDITANTIGSALLTTGYSEISASLARSQRTGAGGSNHSSSTNSTSSLVRTSAYHPAANGTVPVQLKSHSKKSHNWTRWMPADGTPRNSHCF